MAKTEHAGEREPFRKGERVYYVYPEGSQPEGTMTWVAIVLMDDGGEWVVTSEGQVLAERLRLDRRGRDYPVYAERPLTREEMGVR